MAVRRSAARRGGAVVQVSAILKGALAGLVAGAVIAAALASLRFWGGLAGIGWQAGLWVGKLFSFVAAGLVAGRSAEDRLWLHGAIAALTLNLVAQVASEQLGVSQGSLWLELAFSTGAGWVGGVLAAISH
jgi:hydroxylaminobenzene mutase